jgi:hypothetical protein
MADGSAALGSPCFPQVRSKDASARDVPTGNYAFFSAVAGRIAATIDEAMRAVPEVLALDRKAIRRRFEERFSSPPLAMRIAIGDES